jgi:hypothetical protein
MNARGRKGYMMGYRYLYPAIAALLVHVSLPSAWGQTAPLGEFSHVHGVGFDPSEPGSILLATHHGVFRANPDGTAVAVSTDSNDYMGFSIDPGNSGRLLASGHPAGGGNMGVIVSHDGGVTWTQLAKGVGGPVDFHAIAISRADPNVVYGLHGDIQISRDGGSTWVVAGRAPGRVIDLAASASEADHVYAGTATGLMLSTDAGETWSPFGPPDVAVTMIETAFDGSVYAFFYGAGLFRLSAAEGNWHQLAGAFGDTYVLHLAVDPNDASHLVAITEKSAVLESADGGQTWEVFGQ